MLIPGVANRLGSFRFWLAGLVALCCYQLPRLITTRRITTYRSLSARGADVMAESTAVIGRGSHRRPRHGPRPYLQSGGQVSLRSRRAGMAPGSACGSAWLRPTVPSALRRSGAAPVYLALAHFGPIHCFRCFRCLCCARWSGPRWSRPVRRRRRTTTEMAATVS